MKFQFYDSSTFRTIISDVYKLIPHQIEKNLYIYKSKYSFKNNLFHLPFQFYQPKEYFTNSKIRIFTELLNSEKAVSFNSIGKINSLESNKIAINPILQIDKDTNPVTNYKKRFRTQIRKYEKYRKLENIQIIKSNNPSDLKIFYNHLAKSYTKKHKMIFQPYAIYEKLIYENGFLVLAKFENELLGGGFFIEDCQTLHYGWGSYSNTKEYSVASEILNFAISYAWEQGLSYFDFGSTPLTDENLLFSKLKYGSEPLGVYQYSNFDKRVINLNDDMKILRNIFSFSPVKINKSISKLAVPFFV
jgi:hypothetical protein